MRLPLVLLVALTACAAPHPARAPAPSRPATAPATPPPQAAPPVAVDATLAAADAAYAAGDFAACAVDFTRAADALRDPRQQSALYNAACCHARAGALDASLAAMRLAVAAGLYDLTSTATDPDLVAVRADPRWPALLADAAAAEAAFERTLAAPALRRELLALVVEDQAARAAMIAGASGAQAAIEAIDRRTTARMQAVIAERGWPGRTQVGADGAHAAWLLVQHADRDPAFQARCLALMQPLVATGEVAAIDVAYLVDRVAVAEGRPQRYGTQFGPDREPRPIEDEALVDARRAAIGLPTMAAYRAQMLRVYGPPPAAPPPTAATP